MLKILLNLGLGQGEGEGEGQGSVGMVTLSGIGCIMHYANESPHKDRSIRVCACVFAFAPCG